MITRELIRDPCELVFEDGKRYATQRWITRYSDIHETEGGCSINFGWVHIGTAFPTPDSVSSPFYEPPKRSWLTRLAEVFR